MPARPSSEGRFPNGLQAGTSVPDPGPHLHKKYERNEVEGRHVMVLRLRSFLTPLRMPWGPKQTPNPILRETSAILCALRVESETHRTSFVIHRSLLIVPWFALPHSSRRVKLCKDIPHPRRLLVEGASRLQSGPASLSAGLLLRVNRPFAARGEAHNQRKEQNFVQYNNDEGTPGGRRPFRPPDQALEP